VAGRWCHGVVAEGHLGGCNDVDLLVALIMLGVVAVKLLKGSSVVSLGFHVLVSDLSCLVNLLLDIYLDWLWKVGFELRFSFEGRL